MLLIWLECNFSLAEDEIPSKICGFKVPTLKSRGWSSGGDELDTFDDKAGTLHGETTEEHDMKEPVLRKHNSINKIHFLMQEIIM